jgi:hypothetical protein
MSERARPGSFRKGPLYYELHCGVQILKHLARRLVGSGLEAIVE